ncbi:hypothetical protein [Pyrococcus sp. NA2]|uniref:hypothetical protein n=1 Tax=Pyrococcus sp. (strain NA2) TaxID=342949 RepID=UPI001ED93CC4|nr:hypothetical protein [Pyrococcus sp. NA2]
MEEFMYRHSRDVVNRLRLSRILEEARRLAPQRVPVYVSDVDSLMRQYYDNGRRRRFIGFEFKNMRPGVGLRGSWLKVNGKQYELHYYFSQMAGIDFYYIVRVGDSYYVWDVKRTPVDFKWMGDKSRNTYDYYALIPREFTAKVEDEELALFLSELVFKG